MIINYKLIRRLRKESGLSQVNYATEIGLDLGTVTNFENKRGYSPYLNTLITLARYHDLTLDELMIYPPKEKKEKQKTKQKIGAEMLYLVATKKTSLDSLSRYEIIYRGCGYNVINPRRFEDESKIEHIFNCDVMALKKYWGNDKGCRFDVALGLELGARMIDIDTQKEIKLNLVTSFFDADNIEVAVGQLMNN